MSVVRLNICLYIWPTINRGRTDRMWKWVGPRCRRRLGSSFEPFTTGNRDESGESSGLTMFRSPAAGSNNNNNSKAAGVDVCARYCPAAPIKLRFLSNAGFCAHAVYSQSGPYNYLRCCDVLSTDSSSLMARSWKTLALMMSATLLLVRPSHLASSALIDRALDCMFHLFFSFPYSSFISFPSSPLPTYLLLLLLFFFVIRLVPVASSSITHKGQRDR